MSWYGLSVTSLRRRRRPRPVSWLLAALLLAGLLGVLGNRLDLLGRISSQDCQTALCCEDCPELRVTRVIDGDTFDAPEGRVRLFGVDTPERNEECYGEATRRLRQLTGNRVKVEKGPRADDGSRLLYYVYTRSGASIDELLVREGLARAWTRDGQHRNFLVSLENSAKTQSTGCLWR